MPADERISRSLDILSADLSQDRLEILTTEFDALAQDRSETLVFFVLKNVCQPLASALVFALTKRLPALAAEAGIAIRLEGLTVGTGARSFPLRRLM